LLCLKNQTNAGVQRFCTLPSREFRIKYTVNILRECAFLQQALAGDSNEFSERSIFIFFIEQRSDVDAAAIIFQRRIELLEMIDGRLGRSSRGVRDKII